jgi:hypothetical protein
MEQLVLNKISKLKRMIAESKTRKLDYEYAIKQQNSLIKKYEAQIKILEQNDII